MEWVAEHWGTIAAVLVFFVNVINGVTQHWTQHHGAKRVLLWVAELLSVIASKGEPKRVKLPGQTL